jgi:hypothetical protein
MDHIKQNDLNHEQTEQKIEKNKEKKERKIDI